MKEYQKAREFLERALKQEKGVSGTIVEHYGDVLFQLGEKDKAIEQWKKARSMGENSTNIDKKIQSGALIE
jgi:predicted negative regulator of RcsB-dependent stress response